MGSLGRLSEADADAEADFAGGLPAPGAFADGLTAY